ncbi:MAG: glycerol-3-phosphate acyltransferase [Lachnospiraceae bacterium]|nr:glycerol-3-phosphate acyltransferase [Lachnospiraceae bacterium]
MKIALLAVICYLIGCLNPAYFLGKIKGYDIRERGSLNAGASNVVINIGKVAGVFTALFDIFKSFFCYRLGAFLLPDIPFIGVMCAAFCILGHIFPVFMKFKGGKGFASLGGMVLGFSYKLFLIMLMCAVVIVLIVDYLCIITSLTAISFPIIYGAFTHDLIGTAIALCVGLVIISKHKYNFRRIKLGTEARFSGIWNRAKEEERIRQNIEKNNDKKCNI